MKERKVDRRIKATVLKGLRKSVYIETMTGDSLGAFDIPDGKDPDEYMVKYGYSKCDPDEYGEVWIKRVTL